jgi:hypothetical protein
MPTVLLCHCDGTNGSTTFTDVSPSAHTLTAVSTAAVSTAQVKFGTGAAIFSGNGAASVRISGSLSDFDFQGGQFTIECWAYASSTPGVSSMVSQFNNVAGGGWFFGAVSGSLQMWCYDGAAASQHVTSSTVITTGAWHFYTVDRDASGLVRLYFDGAVTGSLSVPTFQSAALQTNIGQSNRNADNWTGYIDEVRVTKGTALYAGAFTPPTGPFANGGAAAQARAVILA